MVLVTLRWIDLLSSAVNFRWSGFDCRTSRPGSLNIQAGVGLTMAMEEKSGVQVVIILMREVDVQKAYSLGIDVIGKVGGIFNGFNVFTFGASNPPRDRQTLGFVEDPNRVGETINAVVKGLGTFSERLPVSSRSRHSVCPKKPNPYYYLVSSLLAFWIIVSHVLSPLTWMPATSVGVLPQGPICGFMKMWSTRAA